MKAIYRFCATLATAILSLSFCGIAVAQSADALINKLVEKGILSSAEAADLRKETENNSAPHPERTQTYDWVKTIHFNGDLRGRYDGIYSDVPGIVDRHRLRYRLRFGAIASLQDDFEIGMRLASSASTGGDGGGDPISTNDTFGNNGNRKGIGIDLVYARWSPIHTPEWNGAFTFGKMENPFTFSELVFDHDYTPEGFSEQFGYKLNDQQFFHANFGQFILDELSSSSRDPWMFGAQGRLDSTWNKQWQSTLGLGGLGILHPRSLTSSAVPNVNVGNTRSADGILRNDFNLLIVDAALVYSLESFPLYSGKFPIRLGGEFVHNFGASRKNDAFEIGPTFGKAGKRGTWEFSAKYKELAADSIYEEIVDSDYGGFYQSNPIGESTANYPSYRAGTNVRGPVFRLAYSPRDFLTLSAMYSLTELVDEVSPGSKGSGSRLLFDAIFKF